ncbi:hypothetical protein BAUCODRAFT_123242 [Baudoinia panamericana UAMH 10762]|uniref:Uncharacterized protein n=1 Tax=Baudoinia panamericana (strain UAMH 10762) TaxID=717646 RepID=M2MH75_BAUPA|nr:uncharacterized protein BAUCODRAFT_123242 [Baudoinia panamericana UAMH 10762]EMC95961.1 hypothetical protein BAUCODRAFT_123242 [Baudoinia panamericana UAMH 10762]
MSSGNPTLDAAQKATGMEPLNAQPSEPQPPQHGAYVKDPTIDTVPPALQGLHPPFEAFVLALDSTDSRSKNNQSVNPATYPTDSEFENLVKAGLKPEGPVRAEAIKPEDVEWPEGYREVVKHLESVGDERNIKAYKVVEGRKKAEMFVLALDLDNDRLVGVRFPA